MERLIKDANEWGKENGKASDLSIDSFSDVITAIEQIQEKQRIAGTTAKEAGTTIEGSIGAAKSAWSDLLTELGKDDGNIQKAMDNLIETIVGDGTDENKGVLGNVIPRLSTIVSNVAREIPGLVMQVAPQVSEAFVTLVDSATGGLASRVLTFLSPITTAIETAFSSISTWVSSNSGAIDTLVASFGNFAGVVVDVLGGAIETVAPIIGDLASAALPLLSSALDFAAGAVTGLADFFSNLGTAVSPITDLLAPVIESIGTALVDALTLAGETMAKADFSVFAENVKNALQGVIDFIADCVTGISGFFDGVAAVMEDPIGAIKGGFAALAGSGASAEASVSGSFDKLDGNVSASLGSVNKSIDTTNGKKLESKKATAKVTGNGVDGTAKTTVGKTSDAIKSLKNKEVEAKVKGNAKDKSTGDNIWNVASAIGSLAGKTVEVVTNYISKHTNNAEGGVRYHADGYIANRYGSGVPLDIVGEDGAEAIIPLTNKRYTRPFADTVAEQMLARMGGTSELVSEVKALRSDVQNMRIVLDSGALVGGISKRMDGSLGRRQQLAGRGVA